MDRSDNQHMPRWRFDGSTYFLTWRVQPGQPDLSGPERDIVQGALKHFNGDRYILLGYVVMNDHVHVIVHPKDPNDLSGILHSWKSFTSHLIQKFRKRQGSLWQAGNYDRIIRSESDLMEKLEYILNNPIKRWPNIIDYKWAEWLPWE